MVENPKEFVGDKVQVEEIEAHSGRIEYLRVVNLHIEGDSNKDIKETSLGLLVEFSLQYPITIISSIVVIFLFTLAALLVPEVAYGKGDIEDILVLLGCALFVSITIKNDLKALKI